MSKLLKPHEWPADFPIETFRSRLADIQDEDFWRLYETWRGETLIAPERIYASCSALRNVIQNQVDGAIVECGVFRGGSFCMLLSMALAEAETLPEFWAFDTFDGFPDHVDDRCANGESFRRENWHTDDFEEIFRNNISRIGYPGERLRVVRGSVLDTIPLEAPQTIAFLHLDTDYYEATLHELQHLYPRVAKGGAILVDDYGAFVGARRAVDEFCATLANKPLIIRIDVTGRLIVPR